jgi:hypothetical protein
MITEKQNRGAGRRLIEASNDEQDVIWHYRRIESLFRQLQVGHLSVMWPHVLICHQTDANLSTWSIANEHLAVR